MLYYVHRVQTLRNFTTKRKTAHPVVFHFTLGFFNSERITTKSVPDITLVRDGGARRARKFGVQKLFPPSAIARRVREQWSPHTALKENTTIW